MKQTGQGYEIHVFKPGKNMKKIGLQARALHLPLPHEQNVQSAERTKKTNAIYAS